MQWNSKSQLLKSEKYLKFSYVLDTLLLAVINVLIYKLPANFSSDLTIPIILSLIGAAVCKISVMYAHEKVSDRAAEQCLNEMYPKSKHAMLQESDEACIIFCVYKKLGIMDTNGAIFLDHYRKRVRLAHQLDRRRNLGSNFGTTCLQTAEAVLHKQDVCKKAKVFNDCTHLYTILLK